MRSYTEPASYTFAEEEQIDLRVQVYADDTMTGALTNRDMAIELMGDYVDDPVGLLADVLQEVGEIKRGTSALSHSEQIDRLVYRVEKLLRPYCENKAEGERGRIARNFAEE